MARDEETYPAIIEKVYASGPHGPYAVASSKKLGSITVSLSPIIWKERDWPECGTVVMLSDIRKKRAGWRAYIGRFLKPSDNHTSIRNQHSNEQGETK